MSVGVSAPELSCRLREAVADFGAVNRPFTLLRLGGLASLLLIGTHEAVHGTLLERPRLEFARSCLISWPMAWPFATYACLHLLHHRWNGRNPRDPERTQPLDAERRAAGPLRCWQQRNCRRPFWPWPSTREFWAAICSSGWCWSAARSCRAAA